MKFCSKWFRCFIQLILLVVFVTCCVKNDKDDDSTIQVKYLPNNFFGPCFDDYFGKTFDEIIITNNVSYKLFGDSIRSKAINLNCSNTIITPIDFSKYILIGKYTIGGGCSVTYKRQIIDDEENKKITYQITTTYSGTCYKSFFSFNWALIPKIPDEYTLEFQVIN